MPPRIRWSAVSSARKGHPSDLSTPPWSILEPPPWSPGQQPPPGMSPLRLVQAASRRPRARVRPRRRQPPLWRWEVGQRSSFDVALTYLCPGVVPSASCLSASRGRQGVPATGQTWCETDTDADGALRARRLSRFPWTNTGPSCTLTARSAWRIQNRRLWPWPRRIPMNAASPFQGVTLTVNSRLATPPAMSCGTAHAMNAHV